MAKDKDKKKGAEVVTEAQPTNREKLDVQIAEVRRHMADARMYILKMKTELAELKAKREALS